MLKIENIIKGLVTTILGAVLMFFAFYGWYFGPVEEQLSDWQAIILGCMGFALCFIRVKIEETLSKLLGDLPAMVWEKYFGKKKE
jgi:membrane-bound ClpP family serine protease